MTNILLIMVSISLAVIAQLSMKHGMNEFGSFQVTQILSKIAPMLSNPWVFTGFALFGLSSIFWLAVLSRMNLSFAYPMVSLAYVAVAFLSMILFKESVSFIRWLGIFIICFGVFLISRS
ncbi:hypothetical protein A2526_01700 [candidate division WOR-1 bacterium RIFOXYD2_FULL_36_8]|uniref:EamA domain-containing protein n=1 Tax=candidate division WOR-1 bacterium RIFOXYB2_FULL_36_35 TaxID=1802578 RepID=A0A1F4S4L0_UNCSA|nr:MAG: hypothetical protein A2230_04600 [candidate division WOR-1 bacterium RIFOXYA2_FULL_36_21]OGC14673.1 MAG: hypothetical protein A2290_01330 [candidate division WOR-1 bacterium RIFOXYB2_FULL_36_35]OGC19691.1 MAG: hypothetical protein A2282_03055 [candidate division WOR-1 bacterium RIFOXYA12_FULL_36_13]OGC39001.1 MAG: hypothetical protein A2526_01700 [candidate division WOR-1 bacterium RIFOXYD2_FULL_36_8]